MPSLDRLDDRRTRRLARDLQHHALATRDLAQDQLQQLGREAGKIAGHSAHDLADYGRQAGALAGYAAHELADYGRHEGAILARAAAVQAGRATRAVKADPVPALVGAVGVVLLANLIFGRRRA
jgi:hypothetical protein